MNDDSFTARWSRRTPALDTLIEAAFAAIAVTYGLMVYSTNDDLVDQILGVAIVVWFATWGLLRIAKYAITRGTNQVATIEMETAAEVHPDGCMCPFCMKYRVENGEEANPHE